MISDKFYPIGTPGQKWGTEDRKEWLTQITIKREYQKEVVSKIKALCDRFDVATYGALSIDVERYPLFVIKTKNWDKAKPVVLITGGVHGYETSGVHGTLQFLEEKAQDYTDTFNLIVTPCVSPWGYETINRWNPDANDPNRSFDPSRWTEETENLMKLISIYHNDILVHIDLHETTDTDDTEFRPALAARDGEELFEGHVPDGFYTVGDTQNPQEEFQAAIIRSVKKVTHIAPADEKGLIIGSKVEQEGVINYAMKDLGLCGGITNARFTTTTEVYPDSEKVTNKECNQAQVAAVVGGLDYVISMM